MGQFELASDFVINDTLKPHINDNFRIVSSPGNELYTDRSGKPVYPKILATGSGNAVHEPFIFEKLIALSGKERPNVCYIGTPFFDREDKYQTGTSSFRVIGCRIKRLMVAKDCTTPSYEEMKRIVVDWSDVVMISGGNSLFAMLRWQSIGLDLLLKEAAINGKVLSGGSAGCGCYFDSMQTDSLKPEACKLSEHVLTELSVTERLDWSFVRITCLGFINAFCVPHIDTVGTNGVARVDIAKRMLLEAHAQFQLEDDLVGSMVNSRPTIFGLGVDEKAAIIYEDGKLSIFSAGRRATGVGEATCHILFFNNLCEVMCIPITPNTGEAMTLDELIARAMRSVEALQCPLDLIVSQEATDAFHRRGCSGVINLLAAGVEEMGIPMGPLPERSVAVALLPNLSSPTLHEPPPPPILSPHTHIRSKSFGSFVDMLQIPTSVLEQNCAHVRSKTRANNFLSSSDFEIAKIFTPRTVRKSFLNPPSPAILPDVFA